MKIGFIGLGIMGQPMALNLLRSGVPLTVWNRSAGALRVLRDAGARVAQSPSQLFAEAEAVILMLANSNAVDEVLQRGTPGFASLVRGRIVVTMGTTSPEYSKALEADVKAAGGHYVEAPVSGSRKPAEAAQLVGMMAGDTEAVQKVQPYLAPMCRQQFICGAVPSALRMKLAVNLFLIVLVTGLAESFHFAQEHELDLAQFRDILDSGPMSSAVSKMKLAKLVAADFSPQAAIDDVHMNAELVFQAAQRLCIETPLLQQSMSLYERAGQLGRGEQDMAAVLYAISALTTDRRTS